MSFSASCKKFQKNLLISSSPLSKIKYYVIRTEFQVKGPVYVPSLLWALNQPVLSESTINSLIEYLDSVVCANLPYNEKDLKLFNLVNPI